MGCQVCHKDGVRTRVHSGLSVCDDCYETFEAIDRTTTIAAQQSVEPTCPNCGKPLHYHPTQDCKGWASK